MFMGLEVLQKNTPSAVLILVDAVHSCTDIEICAPELGTPSRIVCAYIQESRMLEDYRPTDVLYI
jgi:hypothetical protein